ncbi:FtsX-like permease family protein [Georgenia sp. 10Sc9-8]|uniref:FtsX-like permease family protein n=1 Tax=Georgenia halotolerans TaxID=3028317 RepID=A0ABT5U244_9MICO|nr:FtsX-like permease family protein [Georgenia halotolerans]
MWHLTLAHIRTHTSRFALTLLAVVLGVSFVAGALVLADTSERLFEDEFRTANAGVDLTVRDAAAFDSAMGVAVERDPLPLTLLDEIRAVDGVVDARPAASGQGLLEADGEAIVPAGPSLLASWAPEPFGAFTVREGREPRAAGEVVLDVATATAHGITLGQEVTVRSETTATLTVVGLAGFGAEDGLTDTTVALVTLPAAQALLDLEGVSEIQAVAADGVTPTELQRRVGAAIGTGYDVATSQDTVEAGAAAAASRVGMVQVMMYVMAGAALVVGGFLIANTFAIVVSQRSRELALLRAAGATARQLRRSVLGEALVIGVVGALLGTGLGVAASAGLRSLVGVFGVSLPDGGTVLTVRTLAVSVGIGVVVTVLAALGPARRAARVSPVAAMREPSGPVPTSRARLAAGVLAGGAGVVALAWTLRVGAPVAVVSLGALGVLAALTLLGPVLAPALARAVGRPLTGVTGRLARESAARAPRRTAATAMALSIGLTLVVFVSVLSTSVRGFTGDAYAEVVTADYVLESARAEMLGGLDPHVHHDVADLPEVAAASRLRFGHWRDDGATNALTAVEPDTLGEVADVTMVAGSVSDLAGGGVAVTERVATERGLAVGDTLPMTFARTGDQELEVVGIVADSDAQALSTEFLLSMDTYATHFTEDVDAAVLVALADGVGAEAGRAALDEALQPYPTVSLNDQAAAAAARTASLDQMFGLVTVLLLLAVGIAVLGITNTLALSIVERTREIGLLRAIGMTRRQVRWMVRGEAVLVAVLALVVGVGLGVGVGAAAVASLGGEVDAPVIWPVGQLLAIVALTTLAGLLAGMLPARRAARLDVLAAVASR